MNTESAFQIGDVLRSVAAGMHYPVIIILIVFLICAVVLIGWILAEYLTERRHMKVSLPELLEKLRTSADAKGTIEESGLLRRQKDALEELASHPDFTPELREALELLARLAPMFGLLGTLIPLGPGIIALGQGDTFTLSSSMLTAFDTTVAGLLAAAVATIVSQIRRAWYGEYISVFEVLCQCLLEREKAVEK